MATIEYDASQDPDFIEQNLERDAQSLEVGHELEEAQNELLAGKYKSAEELEEAYIELQRAFSSREGGTDDSASNDEAEPELTDEESDAVNFVIDEFQQYGQLTKETAEALGEEAAEIIESILEGIAPTQLSETETSQLQGLVGGPDAYNELVGWASENLNQAEQDAYDSVMASGDVNSIYFAIEALAARYRASVGVEGELIQGRASNTGSDVFRSLAELVRAQQDPRYDRDPAYRMDVEAKLSRSGDLM